MPSSRSPPTGTRARGSLFHLVAQERPDERKKRSRKRCGRKRRPTRATNNGYNNFPFLLRAFTSSCRYRAPKFKFTAPRPPCSGASAKERCGRCSDSSAAALVNSLALAERERECETSLQARLPSSSAHESRHRHAEEASSGTERGVCLPSKQRPRPRRGVFFFFFVQPCGGNDASL